MSADYPILEFDPTPEAVIEPRRVVEPIDVPEHCVLCFFHDVKEEACLFSRDGAWPERSRGHVPPTTESKEWNPL